VKAELACVTDVSMRITFMDESQIHDEPEVIVRDPDDEGWPPSG